MYFTRKQAAAVLIAVTVSQFFGLHLVEGCNKPSKPPRQHTTPKPEPTEPPIHELCVNDCNGDDYMAQYENPLCASDGKLYDNECQMLEAQCEKKQRLEVRDGSFCEDQYEQLDPLCVNDCSEEDYYEELQHLVCASDGELYDNECDMLKAQCDKKQKLEKRDASFCNDQPDEEYPDEKPDPEPPVNKSSSTEPPVNKKKFCDNECTEFDYLDVEPVCGNDGQTYGNECELEKAQCELDKLIGIDHLGGCRKPLPEDPSGGPLHECDLRCPETNSPVCASDGETYDNECLMDEADCERNKQWEQKIEKRHDGPCKDQESSPEPPVNKSVQRMSGAQVRGGRSRTSSRARGRSSNPRASSSRRRDRFWGSRWRG